MAPVLDIENLSTHIKLTSSVVQAVGNVDMQIEAGFLELDNGACARALKPVALARKNWLQVGSDKGGQTAAVLMSLCTTCKTLDIDPEA